MKGPKILIWGLAAMVLLAVGIAVTRPAASIREDIGNAQLRDLQAKGARIVDVRSPGEFAIGHIQGAENVPVEQISQLASWGRDTAIVVYCATGARSYNAAQWLAGQGFTKVYNLKAGVAAWDGQLTKDASPAPAAVKTNGKPILIDFYSDT
ncbi:MAG TPA: rhodanese-like domain-containing protein [Coriobacteriia bacterium]|jgi:rhodanese-related sulfurtransferase